SSFRVSYPSFPTPRSSDLARCIVVVNAVLILAGCVSFHAERLPITASPADSAASDTAAPNLYAPHSERYPVSVVPTSRYQLVPRSAEHTSELQSRFDLVCR